MWVDLDLGSCIFDRDDLSSHHLAPSHVALHEVYDFRKATDDKECGLFLFSHEQAGCRHETQQADGPV